MKQSKWLHRLKYIITGLAAINLVLLFGFHYELPSFIQYKLDQQKNKPQEEESLTNQNQLTIHFEQDTLTYSGNGDLNLTKGVTVTKNSDVEVKASLFSEIQPGNKKREKIITYIAEDSYGNTGTATRTLRLKGYDGPSIRIGEEYPSIDDTELANITDIFRDTGVLSATDGYDNDITSSVEATYTFQDMEAKQIRITFEVTNMFGDKATETLDMEIDRTKPLIVLTKNVETLSVGSVFTPSSYIASATDKDGNDISTAVITEGTIDTNTAGTYRLTFKLTDAEGIEADPVSLKITVN